MGDTKPSLDLAWPTFQNTDNSDDNKITYSPDPETENIFTDFQPATEKHRRNKKRKPRKPKAAKSLRLISESDFTNKSESCLQDRCKCIIISVLVVCIIVIISVCIFVGVYFGVIMKGSQGPKTGQSQAVEAESTSTVTVLTTTPLKQLPPVASSSKPLVPISSSSSTTSSTSTSTSTTSTTTTATTTTTTTTTTPPPPTEPPVIEYTGSDAENQILIHNAKKCVEYTITTTDRLSNQQKCELYAEMKRCLYILVVSDQLYVPVDSLGQLVEANWDSIFPIWIEIKPETCKDEDLMNISTLPRELKDLCGSPDAVILHAKYDCRVFKSDEGYLTEDSDKDKCRILWGTLGCVAEKLNCPFETISEVANNYNASFLKPVQLDFVNTIVCQEMYTSVSSQSPCVLTLYTYMVPIFNKCSPVIQRGSLIAESLQDNTCNLFEAFFGCSYNQIPEITRYETCNGVKDSLRQISYDIAVAASKVNRAPPFTDITPCIDTPMLSTYICKDTMKLLTVVDTHCYNKFRFLTADTVCQFLRQYIYECAPKYLEDLGMTCSVADIKTAVITENDLIFSKYGIQVEDQRPCIDNPAA